MMILKELQVLREKCTEEQFRIILNTVEDDIKFNRIKFKKCTSQKKFLEILIVTSNIVLSI